MGLAVLRPRQAPRCCPTAAFARGSHPLLDAQGITEGPLVDRMRSMILSIEGADHTRVRRVSRALPRRP